MGTPGEDARADGDFAVNSGLPARKQAMPRLLDWCDEASVAHRTQAETELPAWEEADRRMRETGRVSKVWHPGPQQAGMDYAAPRTRAATVIRKG